MPGYFVSRIRLARNALFEQTHNPRHRCQPRAPGFDPGSVAYAAVDVCRRPRSGLAGVGVDFREEQSPALDDLASSPAMRAVGISFHNDMQVITHDREGQHIDGESLDLALDAPFQPRTAVLGGITTEERPPHTATDQLKGPRSGS